MSKLWFSRINIISVIILRLYSQDSISVGRETAKSDHTYRGNYPNTQEVCLNLIRGLYCWSDSPSAVLVHELFSQPAC